MPQFVSFPQNYINSNFTAVTSNGTVAIAVANQGPFKVMRSADNGVTWTPVGTPLTGINARDLTWTCASNNGGTTFVIAANAGTNRVAYSTDSGVTWTQIATLNANGWNAIAWSGTRFGLVGSGTVGTATQKSTDGITWTAVAASSALNWKSVSFGGTYWVAVASDGLANATVQFANADNFASWTAATTAQAGTTFGYQSVAYVSGTGATSVWVAVGNADATNRLIRSTDGGATWTASVGGLSTSVAWSGVALTSTAGRLIAVGGGASAPNTRIAVSTDSGVTFTAVPIIPISTSAAANLWSAVWSGAGGATIVVSSSGPGTSRILRSADAGATFTPVNNSYASTRLDAPIFVNPLNIIDIQGANHGALTLRMASQNLTLDTITLTFGADYTGWTHEVIAEAIVSCVSSEGVSDSGALIIELPEGRTLTSITTA